MTLAISEIFDYTSKLRVKQERVDYLRSHASEAMKWVVRGAYAPEIEWTVKGPFYFRGITDVDNQSVLYTKYHMLQHFISTSNQMTEKKKSKIFLQFLESLYPPDAVLITSIVEKKINYPFLTYALFQEAFPEWLTEREEDAERRKKSKDKEWKDE